MERPHYRRVKGSGAPKGVKQWSKQDNTAKQSTFSERLVTQFIICGVIMALILILNLIDTSLTHNIKYILQDQPTTDDVKQVITEASNTVKTIFGNTAGGAAVDANPITSPLPGSAEITGSPAPSKEQAAAEATGPVKGQSGNMPADFRIDEDILTQINSDLGK